MFLGLATDFMCLAIDLKHRSVNLTRISTFNTIPILVVPRLSGSDRQPRAEGWNPNGILGAGLVGRAVLCPPPVATNAFGFTTTARME
jgi:hypothetical protein